MVKAWQARNILLLILFLCLTSRVGRPVFAQEEEPPKRQTTLEVKSNLYEWWLIRWTDNLTACQLFVEHEGVPTGDDVLADCGEIIYDQWVTTPPCIPAEEGKSTFKCSGLYFYEVGYKTDVQPVIVELPPPTIWTTLSGCSPVPPENFCQDLPKLLLTGEEPLPNEQITAIHVSSDGNSYTCETGVCEIPLQPTPLEGTPIEFWADSSFGDSSEHFSALVRVLDSGVPASPGAGGWYIDVLSSQWRGGPIESCAQIWQSFPPAGGPPFWLSSPSENVFLTSAEPFQYLAGRLISQGLVDASACPSNGLLDNGYADACGLENSRDMVDLWQNQFDPRIINVAQETGLPAQLLKNLFAQESQFWPGIFRVAKEYGLGQITDLGADTFLLWNPSFFDQFCPLVLSDEVCAQGYLRLDEGERAILRGALAIQANADCSDCATGIDLTQADFSVMLFAQGLLANCSQVGQTITNATQSIPGTVSSYEDLWRFTLANYNGGPGCLAFAIHTTWGLREPLDWEHVSTHFTDPCKGVISYIELITR